MGNERDGLIEPAISMPFAARSMRAVAIGGGQRSIGARLPLHHEAVAYLLLERAITLDPDLGKVDGRVGRLAFVMSLIHMQAEMTVRLGSRDFPQTLAPNPHEFAARVRASWATTSVWFASTAPPRSSRVSPAMASAHACFCCRMRAPLGCRDEASSRCACGSSAAINRHAWPSTAGPRTRNWRMSIIQATRPSSPSRPSPRWPLSIWCAVSYGLDGGSIPLRLTIFSSALSDGAK